ncbi:HNH endonuclease signature motif containing protein [Dactylosporangium sp. NPDC000244]|uniref:HNH endonuclease signature motif containing protein n=1 Tax=Dactylosporangium sp. NPDC000244 TaxID=3154365 RepID=UPI00333236E4
MKVGVKASGYARIKVRGRWRQAHRAAYELWRGQIPAGMHVDHECHNRDEQCPGGPTCLHRRCINPDHLRVATPLDNMRNCSRTTYSINRAKTHCPAGHKYDSGNVRISRDGKRSCDACASRCKRDIRRRSWDVGAGLLPSGADALMPVDQLDPLLHEIQWRGWRRIERVVADPAGPSAFLVFLAKLQCPIRRDHDETVLIRYRRSPAVIGSAA